jgi:hypothetical protein
LISFAIFFKTILFLGIKKRSSERLPQDGKEKSGPCSRIGCHMLCGSAGLYQQQSFRRLICLDSARGQTDGLAEQRQAHALREGSSAAARYNG